MLWLSWCDGRVPPFLSPTVERTLYFKLPISATRFHWTFLDRRAFLSGKLTLRIVNADRDRDQTPVIFRNGKITEGWGSCRPPAGRPDAASHIAGAAVVVECLQAVQLVRHQPKERRPLGAPGRRSALHVAGAPSIAQSLARPVSIPLRDGLFRRNLCDGPAQRCLLLPSRPTVRAARSSGRSARCSSWREAATVLPQRVHLFPRFMVSARVTSRSRRLRKRALIRPRGCAQ